MAKGFMARYIRQAKSKPVRQTEKKELKALVVWLKYQYPECLFKVDFSAGLCLSQHQATELKSLSCGKGFPDLIIIEPRGDCVGLAIEFKKSGTRVTKKNGTAKKDEHLDNQRNVLEKFHQRGWLAFFGLGFEETKTIIENYLEGKCP